MKQTTAPPAPDTRHLQDADELTDRVDSAQRQGPGRFVAPELDRPSGRSPMVRLPEPEPARRYDQRQDPPLAGHRGEPFSPDLTDSQTPALPPSMDSEIDQLLERERDREANGGKVSGEQDQMEQGA